VGLVTPAGQGLPPRIAVQDRADDFVLLEQSGNGLVAQILAELVAVLIALGVIGEC